VQLPATIIAVFAIRKPESEYWLDIVALAAVSATALVTH
jgi:hypothetical protein